VHTPPPPASTATAERIDRTGAWAWAAYAVALAAALALAWAPFELLLGHILYEDFFYYLGVADHIVRGDGATFDGTAPTNGFHPMWMAVCVLLEAVADRTLAMRLSLVVAAVLHVAQAMLLRRLLRRLRVAPAIAWAATLFFLFSYRAIAWNLCGLEPPVQGLFLLLAIDRLVAWRTSDRTGELLLLGLCLGANALARFDGLLFAVFALAGTMLGRAGWRARLRAPLLAGSALLLTLLPWFVWSLHHSGVLLPNSQAALAIWSTPAYGFDKSLAANTDLLLAQLNQSTWGIAELLSLMGLWPFVSTGPSIAGGVAWALAVAGVGVMLLRWRRGAAQSTHWLLYAFAVAHAGYYVVCAWAEPRYLMPTMLTLLVLLACIVDTVLQRAPQWRPRVLAAGLALYAMTLVGAVDAWRNHHGISLWHVFHGDLYRAANWIRDNTPPDAIVGGWNCGIVGYHSGRTVVNLDGVINDDALEPLRRRELARYIDARHIRWLADADDQIVKFMSGYSGDPTWHQHWRPVFSSGTIFVLQRID
jgi:hypothetical protein